MIRIESNVFIRRPPEDVFSFVADFENNPRWQSGMIEASWTSDGPLAVGSTYVQVARFLGKRIESSFRVAALDPGRLVKIETVSGSFPITVTRTVDPATDGSAVKAVVEGDSRGFFRVAEPIMTRLVKRSVDGDYARLKALLEADRPNPD